ncbi:glycosyltransferase [Lysinibacillus piscis]|uniref:Group 1 glycosyl transferase n=1 Tax=Lysinibacillus piscis TaxID=2518931 RepID=A0ABQ5NHQ5_9BACI|nr:glycosyltransferase [Lysinibacillus sp. KH24]GLC87886.1 group 1 glycosyl transferase [Lysinibacillus sp. KH24]
MNKILIFDRMNSSEFPGGDTVQINAIKNFLVKHNYDVKISTDPLEDLSEYHYIFIFNLTNPLEAYVCMKACEKYNKPYILFPVYWNLDSLKMPIQFNLKMLVKMIIPNFLKSYIRALKFLKNNHEIIGSFQIKNKELFNINNCIRSILRKAFYVCPNSYAEWKHLNDNFELNQLNKNVKVIYNGIDLDRLRVIEQDDSIKAKYNLPENYICCVGGIGPRKNQLNLVKAANRGRINLVLIGKASYGYENYFKKVKSISRDNIYFLEQLPQEEVFKIMKSSIGHIQPSFIETPGLASLEAMVLDIPIIVSNTEPVKEYFKDIAVYCIPYEVENINECLLTFKNEIGKKDIQRYTGYNYDWNHVLKELETIL